MLDLLWTHLSGRVDRSMITINELAQTNAQMSESNQVPLSAGRNKRTLNWVYFSFNQKVIIWEGGAVMWLFLHLFCFLPCLILQEHSGRVFRLQFDEFQIVSSSHDDTILIWDFLNVPVAESSRSPVRTYTYVSK